ncbi:MAG: hypothetical protein RLZZ174_1043 [Pseudomonadota bacterium]
MVSRATLLLSGLLLAPGPSPGAAPIYRIEVPGHPPLFTDRPAQLATPQANLGAASSFTLQATPPPAVLRPQEAPSPPAQEMAERTIAIASPQAGEALRANGGTIRLELIATPPLEQDEALAVYLDDKAPKITREFTLALANVERGEHRLRVERRQGNVVLAQSEGTFYVLRTALGRAFP